ncbi:hypothetical protein DXB46_10315 [Lachnospiraceae bacterium OM04-12BH]|nr:hypothetical protein DXB46_10315 [Lachnospiraceae bacterium OM04-12BH]
MRIRRDAPGKRGHPFLRVSFFVPGMLKFILENGILEVPHKARKGFRQRMKGSLCKAVVGIWQQNFMQ